MNSDFDALTVLIAARNEEDRIGETVAALRKDFPEAEILVVDGRSEDGTASRAESAGAVVIGVERLGKGEALSAGERAAPPGRLLLCDADLRGTLRPLAKARPTSPWPPFGAGWAGASASPSAWGESSSASGRGSLRASLFPASGSSARAHGLPASRSRPASAARCG